MTGARQSLRKDLPPTVCQCSGECGVVLISVEMKRRGPHRANGHLPLRPLHNPAVTPHENGQKAAAPAGALGFTQHHPSPLAGRPEGTVSVGGQCLFRERAAASLADHL